MTTPALPGPLGAQLQALFQRYPDPDTIALVWPEPLAEAEYQLEVAATPVRLVYCPSELAMRAHLAAPPPDARRLVLVSPFDAADLSKDVLARLWRREPRQINPWRTLEQLLQVATLDPRLTGQNYRWIAPLLVSHYEAYRDHLAFGQVLTFEQAWRALGVALLDYRSPEVDLESLLAWSLAPGAAAAVAALPAEVRDHLQDWLAPRLGPQAEVVHTLWCQGQVADMVALGAVCQLLYAPSTGAKDDGIVEARIRLGERFFGGARLDPSVLRAFGEQSVAFVVRRWPGESAALLAGPIPRAEHILASLHQRALAIASDLMPGGYEQRLSALAKALGALEKKGGMARAQACLAAVEAHRLASLRPEQVDRVRHALRLGDWLHRDPTPAATAAEAMGHYAADGSFLDCARSRIWAGDEHEGLNGHYQRLSQRVRERREAQNRAFAHHLDAVARGDPCGPALWPVEKPLWPVEKALEALVAPLARENPVLLLVLDGMSQAVYHELAQDLVAHHWMELQPQVGPLSLYAVLPSITQYSRYSLLAGRLGQGLGDAEGKAFAAHPALRAAASTRAPPVLYHKAELQQPGGGGLDDDVRAVIAAREHRVTAAVINGIDDQLASNAQLAVAWRLSTIPLLQQLLAAAREAQRWLIITSDHGHVLDHAMGYRKGGSDGGE
ncbi:MAG: BREX-2 system phosphatase PglZ, partial [Candidatus Competibacterales bacterium]